MNTTKPPSPSLFAPISAPSVSAPASAAVPERQPATQWSWTSVAQTSGPVDIRNVRATCLFGLREYLALQVKRWQHAGNNPGLESRIHGQANLVVGDLQTLQLEIRRLISEAENQRWRRWIFGGVFASFIPVVRRIFCRGSDDAQAHVSANDTEHAFHKSKRLLARIRDGLFGGSGLIQVASFVFAVLYVFQNEVRLRVAKTVQRRLRRLCGRIDSGETEFEDADTRVLEGWRWRILFS